MMKKKEAMKVMIVFKLIKLILLLIEKLININ